MTVTKSKKKQDYEPQILVFCCNWCSYAGADLAGVSRFQYPPNVRIVRVMCSGRVQPTFILDAFANGIDGILVTGCHIGDCHYISGNELTQVRMEHLKKLIKDFTKTVKQLGESKIPKKKGTIELEYCQ